MNKDIRDIKRWIIVFMISLALSGITAIPAETELSLLVSYFPANGSMGKWLERVFIGIRDTNNRYPFLAYGYDWLAFAHIVLAVLFIGPLKDPVKNKWVIEFAIIACLMIIPFAMIAGYFRGIPIGCRLIDCSFGVIGIVPLKICLNKIYYLETIKANNL